MDEVLLVVRGKTEDWRIQRNNAFLIHRSLVEKPVNIFNELPLPFDDELKEMQEKSVMSEAERLYNLAKEQGII